MSLEKNLQNRSSSECELCKATEGLAPYTVPPKTDDSDAHNIYICSTCQSQIDDADKVDANHWRCLNESMWSEVPAVQVVAWRMLSRLNTEAWAQDLLEMLYLDDETIAWAKTMDEEASEAKLTHKDSNGTILQAGDTVTLIKDLNVKGANFTAKRGTAVRNISLVADNAAHIEGRVSGQQIVILTQFTKKSN
jgi:protein PhnA